jgi:hypothetical protein
VSPNRTQETQHDQALEEVVNMERLTTLKTKVRAVMFLASLTATVVALGAPFKWGCFFS